MPPDGRERTSDALSVELMEHQKLGLSWLMRNEEGTNRGGILADGMGLGKTVQALALIAARPSTDMRVKTTLIVAPLSLLDQWKEEIENKLKRNSKLSVYMYHKSAFKKDLGKRPFDALAKYDIVLTTYSMLSTEFKNREKMRKDEKILIAKTKGKKMEEEEEEKEEAEDNDEEEEEEEYDGGEREGRSASVAESPNDQKQYCLIGKGCQWYRVILDEAHLIKNTGTLLARSAYALKSKYRLCMTGTPLINGVNDAFSLVKFLRIRPYSDWNHFRSHISLHMESENATLRHLSISTLQELLKSILLRRTMDSTIDGKPIFTLPETVVEKVFVEFSEEEKRFYDSIHNQLVLVVSKYLNKNTVGKSYRAVFERLLRLRQVCCHPHIIKGHAQPVAQLLTGTDASASTKGQSISKQESGVVHATEEHLKYKNGASHDFRRAPEGWTSSAKIDKTMQILQHNSTQGEKTLIFSNFTSMLDLLEVPIGRAYMKYARLDGSMTSDQRTQAVKKFQKERDCKVLLLSLCAGNVGLNLTVASQVILVEPFWHPFFELQAICRAVRYGQKNRVHVHRLLVKDTIEERILAKQDKKNTIIDSVLDGKYKVEGLGEDGLRFLLVCLQPPPY